MLVNGVWVSEWQPVQNKDADGRFVRQTSTFRDWITADGSLGPECQKSYPAEAGRYHLFVAFVCPWASRTLMARVLNGLEEVISVSVVDPRLSEQGWRFGGFPGSNATDTEIGAGYLHEIYTHSDPQVSGRATVPVLWDRMRKTIVNNESADILRILNSGFGGLAKKQIDLRPDDLLSEIEALNDQLYDPLNNGVYMAGFASSQMAYDEAVEDVFATLDALERRLSDGRAYLLGDTITECDIRAFVTLIRFDAAYVGLFKTNRRRIADYPFLQGFLRRILDLPGIRQTVRIDHIKAGYYSIKSKGESTTFGDPTDPDDFFGNTAVEAGGLPCGTTPDTTCVYVYDYLLTQVFAEASFDLGEWPTVVFLDYVNNSDPSENDTGWMLGTAIGQAKDRGQMQFIYYYAEKEADSMLALVTDSDFGGGGTDSKGHWLQFTYGVNKSWAIGAQYFINETDLASGSSSDYNRLMIDMQWKWK